MPEQDTDVFQVLVGQMRERRDIDPVIRKALRVLGHAELFEPVRICCIAAHPADGPYGA